jgi:hypothetical protein
MAIETRIQTRQTVQNVAYAVLCLGLAIWGWVDYSISIPAAEAAFKEYVEAEKSKSTLEERSRVQALTDAEKTEYTTSLGTLAKYKEKPAEPAAYDRAIQLWMWIVGCGVLGVPWFVLAQWQLSRKRFRLGDDGSLATRDRTIPATDITGIDMSRWMSKSIAAVQLSDGSKIELDDYKYKGVEDIVAALASRFYPGEWTSDARPIGDPKSRDTKRAQLEEAALEQQEATEQDSRRDSDGPPIG